MRKIFLCLFSALLFVAIITTGKIVLASNDKLNEEFNHFRDKVSERVTKFTNEQKEVIKEKAEELKKEFLSDLENKTKEEKQKAINQFKEELNKFCEDKFGTECSFSEKRRSFWHYFNFKRNKNNGIIDFFNN